MQRIPVEANEYFQQKNSSFLVANYHESLVTVKFWKVEKLGWAFSSQCSEVVGAINKSS